MTLSGNSDSQGGDVRPDGTDYTLNSEIRRYRKKPVVIEAVHYTGAFPLHFLSDDDEVFSDPGDGAMCIRTLEGVMRADIGDYVIRGVKGELYPCKPDIFEATYEPADEPGPQPGPITLTSHEARALRLASIFGTPDPTPPEIVSALEKIRTVEAGS